MRFSTQNNNSLIADALYYLTMFATFIASEITKILIFILGMLYMLMVLRLE